MRSEKAIRDRIARKDKERTILCNKKRETIELGEILDTMTQSGFLKREIDTLLWVLEESCENGKVNKRKIGRPKKHSKNI
ncbi:MAG TPA: hypothetical protein P5136_01005 [Methanofastidiosum sp.]|nr:hypothetical protein [Methanofastidiosum sp.]